MRIQDHNINEKEELESKNKFDRNTKLKNHIKQKSFIKIDYKTCKTCDFKNNHIIEFTYKVTEKHFTWPTKHYCREYNSLKKINETTLQMLRENRGKIPQNHNKKLLIFERRIYAKI